MNVTIIGSGVVGKATGLALAVNGHEVLFYDVDRKAFQGLPAFCETTTDTLYAVDNGDVLMVCVPTPCGKYATCDLSVYEQVIDEIGQVYQCGARDYKVIVQKSTCPPGTASRMVSRLVMDYGLVREDFGYVVSPEFLNAGAPVRDAVAPTKVVFGFEDEVEAEKMRKLYHWVNFSKITYTTYGEAEFLKYANNLFHALLISMWNELDGVAKRFESVAGQKVDMNRLAHLAATEPGLESIYRVFGKAWGGACLPKDTKAFRHFADSLGAKTSILDALMAVNERVRDASGEQTAHWDELHKG